MEEGGRLICDTLFAMTCDANLGVSKKWEKTDISKALFGFETFISGKVRIGLVLGRHMSRKKALSDFFK